MNRARRGCSHLYDYVARPATQARNMEIMKGQPSTPLRRQDTWWLSGVETLLFLHAFLYALYVSMVKKKMFRQKSNILNKIKEASVPHNSGRVFHP